VRGALAPAIVAVFAADLAAWAVVPSRRNDFFLAGSRPNQSGIIEHPGKCDNCHGGCDKTSLRASNEMLHGGARL
jgi:hypothetical protein